MDNNKIIFSGRSKHPNMNINSRSGSMLVLVLVILAVSIILITSALMISTAGRHRYYKDAEREQASLTAMSAARLICQAVVNNKISVATLENLATNGDPTKLFSITPSGTGAVVNLSSSGIPGLAGTAETNPESNSYAVFGYDTIDGKEYITATVTTTLDADITADASEAKVSVLLERTPGATAFSNLITMGTSQTKRADNFDNHIIKEDLFPAWITGDGYIVAHGDVGIKDITPEGNPYITADVIYTGTVYSKENLNSGRAILWDGAELIAGSKMNNVSYLTYTSDDVDIEEIIKAVSREVLTTIDAIKYIFKDYQSGADVIAAGSAVTKLTQSDLDKSVSDPNFTYDVGKYYINLADSPQPGVINAPLTFDLQFGDVSLYIIDPSYPTSFGTKRSLQINSGIKFINGGTTGYAGTIYLLDGTDIEIDVGKGNPGITGKISNTPYVFIYGLGDQENMTSPDLGNPNKVYASSGTLDAYIGLYGSWGEFVFDKGQDLDLTCRVECAYLQRTGPGTNNSVYNIATKPDPNLVDPSTIYTYEIAGYSVIK